MKRATCPRCGDVLGRREFDLCDQCHEDVCDLGITRLVSGASVSAAHARRTIAGTAATDVATGLVDERLTEVLTEALGIMEDMTTAIRTKAWDDLHGMARGLVRHLDAAKHSDVFPATEDADA